MRDTQWGWLLVAAGLVGLWWWASQPKPIWTTAQEAAYRELVASAQNALAAGNPAAYEDLLNAADMMKARAGLTGTGVRW